MLVSIRNKVGMLKKAGRSLDEVVTAKPTAAYDTKWDEFVIDGKKFTGLVYQGGVMGQAGPPESMKTQVCTLKEEQK
jgi:hypothetical protein